MLEAMDSAFRCGFVYFRPGAMASQGARIKGADWQDRLRVVRVAGGTTESRKAGEPGVRASTGNHTMRDFSRKHGIKSVAVLDSVGRTGPKASTRIYMLEHPTAMSA
jgi:hypothetical protein